MFPGVEEELRAFVPHIDQLQPLEWIEIQENCNWKVSVENYSECYHCQYLWRPEVIDAKTRSMMNLAMIGALGKMHEWEIHCRGAISKDEIRAIIHVVGIYCGVPQALECFRIARKVLDEND